jgi:hypothetical protein
MSAGVFWATFGLSVATVAFVIVPSIWFAWYVLEQWIGDRESYGSVIGRSRVLVAAERHSFRRSPPERGARPADSRC